MSADHAVHRRDFLPTNEARARGSGSRRVHAHAAAGASDRGLARAREHRLRGRHLQLDAHRRAARSVPGGPRSRGHVQVARVARGARDARRRPPRPHRRCARSAARAGAGRHGRPVRGRADGDDVGPSRERPRSWQAQRVARRARRRARPRDRAARDREGQAADLHRARRVPRPWRLRDRRTSRAFRAPRRSSVPRSTRSSSASAASAAGSRSPGTRPSAAAAASCGRTRGPRTSAARSPRRDRRSSRPSSCAPGRSRPS